ncbi:restriction endonuclease subunit S [Ignavibacteriales bacterium]
MSVKILKLEDLAEVTAGQGAPQESSAFSETGNPFIRAGNLEELLVTNDEYASCDLIDPTVAQKYKLKLFPKNTIVFAKSGMSATKGRIYSLMNDSYIVNHLAIAICNPNLIDHSFLKYYLVAFPPSRLIKDSAYPSISLNDIKQIEIPLPPIEEQHRIVKILDQAQLLIEKRKQAIAYLDDYVKAVFLDMFGDPVSNPKGWEVKSIQAISHKITDGEHLNPTFSEGGIPMIMAGHVLESGVDTKSARKVSSELGRVFRKKCNPEKNDLLLVSRGATIGRLCRVATSELFCLMGSVILIKPNHDIVNSAYLSELLKHPRMYSKLFNSSGSSAQQAIYLKDIKKLDCVIPPIEDQRDFEMIVREVDTIKQKMESQLEELENNFQAQLQRAFRGE